MTRLLVPEPVSGGIILSYKCNAGCRHCMYACSPKWQADWMSEKDAELILTQLAERLQGIYPHSLRGIGVNYGVHFTGGEPFLNFELLLSITRMAHALYIPSTFVETNGFWCTNDEKTEEWLRRLKEAGLQGILISANPFILEWVPFERTERAIKRSRKIFGRKNVIVYQEFFCNQFKNLNVDGTMKFQTYMEKMQEKDLVALYEGLGYPSILPMGRATYGLAAIYKKYPASHFFGQSCRGELTRPWHIHIDNYCNYVTGYCGGISLGNAKDIGAICQGIDLGEYPVLATLVSDVGRLYEFAVTRWEYKDRDDGYVSKCHLCLDIRRHVVLQTDQFKELKPKEFYHHLDNNGCGVKGDRSMKNA